MQIFKFYMWGLVATLCLGASHFPYAASSSDVHRETTLATIIAKKDAFGNFHSTPAEVLNTTNLTSMVEELCTRHPRIALYFHQPIADGKWASTLETLGFSVETALNKTKTVVWLFRNGREIPAFSSKKQAARVLVYCPTTKNFMLVKDAATGWIFPGGAVDLGEHPVDAASRELREEAGIEIEVAKLKLMGVLTITKDDPIFGRINDEAQIFFATVDKQSGTPDHKETTAVEWFSLDTLQKETSHEGTRIHPFVSQCIGVMNSEAPKNVYVSINPTLKVVVTENFRSLVID